jgi:thymidylate kinase
VQPPSRGGWRRALARRGPVVAVLGPDGAGKGTVIEGLRTSIEGPVTVIYLGRPHGRRRATAGTPKREARGKFGAVRECLFLARRGLRHLRLLLRGYALAWQGHIVLCDRHPVEVLAVRPPRTPVGALVERVIARRLMPWPDAMIVLDAPAARLLDRKGEHSLEVLERWRRAYLDVFGGRAAIISTDGPVETSVADALAVVRGARPTRAGR